MVLADMAVLDIRTSGKMEDSENEKQRSSI
jgi:hypothetical protein